MENGVAHAVACWNGGLNCAESVLRGVCHAQGLVLEEQAMRMATPFGGGVGRSEDICGALTGGVLAIGLVLGRTEPGQDKTRCYEAAGKLHSSFLRSFGESACKALNKGDFKSQEHAVRCTGFVRETCRLTTEIIRVQR